MRAQVFQTILMAGVGVSSTKLLAIAGGLAVGVFLFFLYYPLQGSSFWGLQWYQSALLLAGIGVAGAFAAAWPWAVFGLSTAGFVGAGVQTYLDISKDPRCCNIWPIGLVLWLILGFPAPWLGGAIVRGLRGARIPRFLYVAVLTGALVIGASLPRIQKAEYDRLETQSIPSLLKRIYAAEMAYRATRPDTTFACDGTQLPEVGKAGWSHTTGQTINNLLIVQDYSVSLDCPNYTSPHSFRVTAFSRTQRGPTFSIDETGQLVVTKLPAR
ncbi:MAG TPA: hypothetical protein VMZ52_06980 [Bryobacteraceae bacterium]|nr:hypothetical protein [Bryobacteraceae bacterium]